MAYSTGPILVSNHDELFSVLSTARGGETILLKGGDYGGLGLYGARETWARFETEVTIASADPDAPAIFTWLGLREVTNLTIEGVVFDYTAAEGDPVDASPFRVRDSAHIAIRNSVFDGDLIPTDDGNAFGTGHGFEGRNIDGLDFSGNEVRDWKRGAVFNSIDDLTVAGNDIHSIRSDGLNFVAVQNVLIEGNYIHDFKVADATGDHQDMIQFWTAGSWHPSENIVIRANLLDIGAGGASHSIFMRNELVDSGGAGEEMFYKNILIEDNLIRNAHLHGITVGETLGLEVKNNTMLHSTAANGAGAIGAPQIRLATASQNVTLTDNVTHGINAKGEGWTVDGNLIVQRSDAARPNHYDDLFINATSDELVGPDELQALPGGAVALSGIGADMSLFVSDPDALIAQAQAEGIAGANMVRVFDAGLTVEGGAGVDELDARYFWNFGDGQSAEGLLVEHAFTEYGDHDVTLRVETVEGAADETAMRVVVRDPTGVHLVTDAEGMRDVSGLGATVRDATATMLVQGDFDVWGMKLGGDAPSFSLGRGQGGIYGAEAFTISFAVQAIEDVEAAAGELFRIHTAMLASVSADGGISFVLDTREGEKYTVSVAQSDLLDGGWSRVAVRFDGVGGELALFVDGEKLASVEAFGHTRPAEYWGPDFGSAWGRDGFEGVISEIEMRAEALSDALLGAEAALWTDAALAPPDASDASDAFMLGSVLMIWAEDEFVYDFDGDPESDEVAAMTFVGDTALTDGALAFDGEGDSVRIGRITELEDARQISMVLDLTREQLEDGGAARLLWNHMKFGIVLGEDRVEVAINSVEEGFSRVLGGDVALNDGEQHRIAVFMDQDADVLQLFADGQLVAERTDLDLEMNGGVDREWGWNLGGIYGRDFAGDVAAFVIGEGRFDDAILMGDAGDAFWG
jgi:hypothetical protein